MATKVKITHKELKKPDKFLEFIDKSTHYLADNYKSIVYFVAGLVVLILLIVLFKTYRAGKSTEANKLYNEAVTAKDAEDYDTALQKFSLLQSNYSGQKAADISLYYTASIYYEKGDYDNALLNASNFLNKNQKNANLKDAAAVLIANSYLNKKEYQKAIDVASSVTNEDSPYLSNAQMTKGLALEKLGKSDEAAEIYNKILTQMYPGSFQPAQQ